VADAAPHPRLPKHVQIFLVSRSGDSVKRITTDHRDHTPTWSPDGKLISDEVRVRGHDFIDVLDRRGRRVHRISVGAEGLAASSDWSPDSRRIAFPVIYGNRKTGADDAKLVVVELATGKRRVIAHEVTEHPQWMPDGKSLLFAHGDVIGSCPGIACDNPYQIRWIRSDGAGERVVVRNARSGPAPAPDGRTFLFFRGKADSSEFTLWTARLDGTHQIRWSEPLFYPEAYWAPPDGRRIRMLYAGKEHAHALVFDGPRRARPLPDAIHWSPMDWSPDAKLIVWGDGNRIRRIHPDGGGLRVLLRFRGIGGCETLEWSPNGRELLLACARAEDGD
jgi:dipeptidyl aminopeptidase/acylaminoacyl peptidase